MDAGISGTRPGQTIGADKAARGVSPCGGEESGVPLMAEQRVPLVQGEPAEENR